jgi:hypothetical protein
MAASLAPKSLLIYYGYPSLINGAQNNLAKAASTLGAYADVVLGDTLELSSNGDHADTTQILANPAMANTMVFGYVDLGVSTENLSISQMETEISDWKSTGVKGIFLDDFGYDFNTTRARQNTIVQYAHSQGLVVMANAFIPADAFGNQVNGNNPAGTATALNANDYYLYESYQIELGGYVAAGDWQTKASQLATYQAAIGFKVMAVTTASQANVFNQAEFNYAWYSALLAGYTAVGWGELDYAADTDSVPSIVPSVSPTSVAVGTAFTGGIIESGSLFTRNTNLGQVELNSATHTGSFTPLPAAPSLTATAVSATQINLSWNTVAGATGYVVEEWIGGVWKPIQTLAVTSTRLSVTALSPGVTYYFVVGAINSAGTDFSNTQSAKTI